MSSHREIEKPSDQIEDILQEMDNQGILKDMLSDGASLLEIITADARYHVHLTDKEENKKGQPTADL